MREYEITTADLYQLKLHRLIHPEDQLKESDKNDPAARAAQRDKLRLKKPYLLVHGLIGTSASFVLNVRDDYQAPARTYQAKPEMISLLKSRADVFQYEWESTASRLQSDSEKTKRDPWTRVDKIFADLKEIVYDGDGLNFAQEFRQAYRKFDLPRESLKFTTNSLAFTLSNFGYDVWMINLRGNRYSERFHGPLSSVRDEYWNFDIGKLVREDFMATINRIQKEKGVSDPIGLVTYSYSSAYVMNLLAKFPAYIERLQPIVMLAPTLLNNARDRNQKSRMAMRAIDFYLSKNGPFPSMKRSLHLPKLRNISSLMDTKKLRAYASILAPSKLDETLLKLICKLPIASQLCRFIENVIHGESESVSTVRGLILPGREKRAMELRRRDSDCGRTSKAILHQIFENIKQAAIQADFMVFNSVMPRQRQLKMQRLATSSSRRLSAPADAAALRRSVILIHAQEDQVGTMGEVDLIRNTALKTLTLLDYVIKTPSFGHTDFLFSQRNQYLVNAEVARQVLLFDFLAYQDYANQPSEVPQGIGCNSCLGPKKH